MGCKQFMWMCNFSDRFEWEKYTSNFDKIFIKKYNVNSDKEYILDVDVKCPKLLHDLDNYLPFLPKEMNFKVSKIWMYRFAKYFVHVRILKH